MASLTWSSRELGFAGRRMTAEEFFSLGETTERLELIDGIVVMSPSPFPIHQAVLDEIQGQLAVAKRGGLDILAFPDTDVEFGPGLVYRPDLVVYRAETMGAIPERLRVPPAPDLIIEILSAGSNGTDLVTKRDDYERFGVSEYWAIDSTPELRLRIWRQEGAGRARFLEAALPTPEEPDLLQSAAVPGFELDLLAVRKVIDRMAR